ncbi:uncharacterized protein HMPREF1541_09645 [Cyphellophora europaea CBS 101466]|uniref:Uncharacterized protein n=1 Tax=Cyphellophora europaea (strain CBS 101466) TaxID=1220924 RepID=W2SAT4_CYPE1|nr:uncharacterized protein HMPREF1541_09645 [Cyphellophora europaea CBS 101466]ETN45812.1 hypothetical protein HMPREF1541_09645 [Cyphellophora europaea CBS 101466]
MPKGIKRVAAVLCSITLLALILSIYSHPQLRGTTSYLHEWVHPDSFQKPVLQQSDVDNPQYTSPTLPITPGISSTYHEIFSRSTPDGKYYALDFGDYRATNPNIIPHPHLPGSYILVAQQGRSEVENTVWFAELSCTASFSPRSSPSASNTRTDSSAISQAISCDISPLILPIALTVSPYCSGPIEHFGWNVGPHDARVVYGPHNPYVIYGSNSQHTCFGQWIQDLRLLVDWGREEGSPPQPYRTPTDLQRPGGYRAVEKNWFIFWNAAGDAYLHHDIYPKRVFAKLEADGSVGEDLAPISAETDEACLKMHMPEIPEAQESIHQATNSLSVTMCKRGQQGCETGVGNTYIMTIIQHKRFYSLHSVYEPYVVLFQPTAPYALHAISKKPIWIHGRGGPGEKRPKQVPAHVEWDQTEMLYVTSMSWKSHGQRYHGHIDDELFVGFGIEDETSGLIDILASDLLEELALC